jgi:hypothetical protein
MMTDLIEARHEDISGLVDKARDGEVSWAHVSLPQRIAMLDQIRIDTGIHAQAWVDIAARIKWTVGTRNLR